jgi:hypothetical protein
VFNITQYANGTSIAYISTMVAQYNAANADHGDAPTTPGWYVDAEHRFDTEKDAMEFAGVTADDEIETE